MSNDNQVSNEVLTSIYVRLGDLQADIASLHATAIAHEDRMGMLSHKLDIMEKDIKGLSDQASKNSVKWAVLTFTVTTLLLSGINYAIGKEPALPVAVLPSNKELTVKPIWPFEE